MDSIDDRACEERQIRSEIRRARRGGDDAVRARARAPLSQLARDRPGGDDRGDADEPPRAVAAEAHSRRRARQSQAAGIPRMGAPVRLRTAHAGRGALRRRRDDRDRRRERHRELHRQLLHGERRPVRGERSAHPHLRAPAPTVARVLRPRADGHAVVDDHQRRRNRAELRLVVDARHSRRPHDHRRHAGAHVLAQLGLHADRHRRHTVPAPVRHALQEGGEGSAARGAQAAK